MKVKSLKFNRITVMFLCSLVLLGIFAYKAYEYYHIPDYEPTTITPYIPTETPEITLPSYGEDDGDDDDSSDSEVEEETSTGWFSTTYSKNKVGWLSIAGIAIDDAVVQYTDNSYYLTHDACDNYDSWGSYFVNCDNNVTSAYELDQVTTIFGHSNGQATYPKFAALKSLLNPTTAASSQIIEFTVGNVNTTWQIFAVGEYPVDNNYLWANPTEDFLEWEIEEMKAASYHTYDVDVSSDDKILILSTCVGNKQYENRYIVCAKLISIG